MVGKGNFELVMRSALCLPLSDTADIPPQDPPYIQDLKMSMMVGGLRSEFYEILTILDRLPIPHLHYALSVFTRLREYGKIAVQNARSASASSKATLFSKIINENAFGNLNDVEIEFMIADEASNFMIGGTDTTSTTLTYLVWAVLRHPKVRQALLAELITIPADPTACELEAAQYLNCIIDETLRLYSAVPGSLRRTTPAGGAMLAGYNIPGNTVVCTQAYTFHRNPSVFQDPWCFDPDRWINPTKEMKNNFIPWGVGSRSCAGIHLAKLQMRHATVMFFRACPDAVIAPSTTPESMEMIDFFLATPISHSCKIINRHA